jgi:SMI1 / KNR4 family (SUKH-1)
MPGTELRMMDPRVLDCFEPKSTTSTPPATDAELDELERRVRRPIPSSVRELYKAVACGQFLKRLFVRADAAHDEVDEFEVHQLYPVRTFVYLLPNGEQKNAYDIGRALTEGTGRLLPRDVFPFAYGGGGDSYVVRDADGAVLFVPHEDEDFQPDFVATSLESFLGGLQDDDEG